MSLPEHIRTALQEAIARLAEQHDWVRASSTEKSRLYDEWTKLPEIGGVMSRYLRQSQIRVYLKDSLLKNYAAYSVRDHARPMRALGLQPDSPIRETFVKPHGRLLQDGRLICWGKADAWKAIIMSVHERAQLADAKPFGAVLFHLNGRFSEPKVRHVVLDAARKLGLEKLIWLES